MITKDDYGISLARTIGVMMIIGCHILQYFGNELAWWLNCGVQLFLGLSGFIYGQRILEDEFDFIQRRFIRILKDYYVCIGISLSMYMFFATEYVNLKGITDLLFCSGTIEGLGHLWFVGTILFCYLLTPFLSKIFDLRINSERGGQILVIVDIVLLHIIIDRFIPHFQAEWIVCYFIGFIVGRIKLLGGGYKKVYAILLPLCFIMNGVQIYVSYFSQIVFESDTLRIGYTRFCNYAHVVLGLSVFFILYEIGSKIGKQNRMLNFANEYSYDIYLAHNVWLNTSPLCIWNLNISGVLKIILVFVAILAESLLIHRISAGRNLYAKERCI